MTDARFATSLAHGLALLDAFADAPAGLSNKQLAGRTGLSKASISRLSTTLVARGLLLFDADTRRYRLGSSALTVGYPLLASLGVRRLARLPMSQLAASLGGTVSLAMHERSRMVYVETCRGHLPLAFRPDVGAALPMLQTAAGRAWLASAAPAERAAVLADLRHHAPAAHAAWTPALAQARRDLDRHGWCLSPGHWQPDVHAVAVPLDMRLGGERLVLNCGLPARRLAAGELAARIGPRLLALARRIEREWQAEQAAAAPPPPWPPVAPPAAATPRRAGDDAASAAAQTLARGLDLLHCFHPGEDVLGNRVLATRLGLSPQTVVRLTFTLTQLGLLRRDPLGTGYRLGAGAVAIAYPMLAGLRLRSLARPAMLALSQRLGAAVSLGLRHQLGMVYVETAWRTDGRLLPPDTGAVMPMLATAMGRAWLSSASAADRQAVLNQIRVREPATALRFAGVAERALAQYERHGHCSSRDFRSEIEAVAVPFSRPVDAIRFVMNCGVLAPAPLPARQVRALGAALTELVRTLEARLAP
ncbi:IclR family transcriptional regulator [Pseudorhodoferax sp.]|uniref:IclR family transcriptional regulator n=1 Tax=Pseudorhodoferax sp. TaxID=1993553 RepID=UPI002DD639DC|nr:helix-turn-helix domain-containing protein [Pseudorhodoferax sp.]